MEILNLILNLFFLAIALSDPAQSQANIPTLIASVMSALIVGAPATIAAWSALKQGQRNSREARAAALLADRKSSDLAIKAEQIHTLTNNTLSEMTRKLEVATEKILGLEKLIAALAKAEAESKGPVAGPPGPPGPQGEQGPKGKLF